MNGEDPGAARVKRMLPSVSEVLKELTARADVGPDVAFRAAREVCAEELKRIRDVGGDCVPIEELVQRALVRATGGRIPLASPAAPPAPEPPARIPDPVFEPAEPAPSPDEPAVEDPFSETAGAMDLRWEREAREPFSEAAPAPEPPAILLSEPEVGPGTEPGAGEIIGPGDETLSRLSREAESIDLNAVFPRPMVPFSTVDDSSAASDAAGTGEDVRSAAPPPFEDDEDTVLTIPRGGRTRRGGEEKGSRVGVLLGVALGLVALAGLGYLLVGLWMERDAAPPPVAVVRPRRAALPAATPAVTPTTLPAAEPTAPSAPGVAAPAAAAAPVPTLAPVPAPTPASVRIAAPRAVPTRPAAVAAAPTTTPVAPPPTLVRSAPSRQSRDGIVFTRDRAGQPEVFSIHFTSYKDRASAERDVKRVEALAGMRGYVAEIDLGEKGIWYRVMAGAFATAREAKEARDALAAKGTRDMGWVYRVVGAE